MAFCAVADPFKMRMKRREISRGDLSYNRSGKTKKSGEQQY
jgi:hypothetical protein